MSLRLDRIVSFNVLTYEQSASAPAHDEHDRSSATSSSSEPDVSWLMPTNQDRSQVVAACANQKSVFDCGLSCGLYIPKILRILSTRTGDSLSMNQYSPRYHFRIVSALRAATPPTTRREDVDTAANSHHHHCCRHHHYHHHYHHYRHPPPLTRHLPPPLRQPVTAQKGKTRRACARSRARYWLSTDCVLSWLSGHTRLKHWKEVVLIQVILHRGIFLGDQGGSARS